MMKFIICPLLGLVYLYVVLTFPSFTLQQNEFACEDYDVQEYNFAIILLESESQFELISMAFSVISGFIFSIVFSFKSKILEAKQIYRAAICLPFVIYCIYGFLIFNLHIYKVTFGLCYDVTYIYFLNYFGTFLFWVYGLFLSLFNEKWRYDIFDGSEI